MQKKSTMKKSSLLFVAIAASFSLQAQWIDDPATNTFIVNASNDAGEIYLSTNEATGDTYVQWNCFGNNGWSPSLQRLNFEGVPQWGEDGIHIGGHQFSSMSEGVSMVSTSDGGVVSCFANYDGYTYAVKINADGTFAWGEQGILLFDGLGFSRTELLAGSNGGFWALGSDYSSSYIQYVNADGTLNPTNTISSEKKCWFGQLTLGKDDKVFLTYEKIGNGFYTDKEIHLIGFATDGTQICDDVTLMAAQSFQSTYIHHVVSDGLGGGYVYIWHSGINNAFNVYVFHFDQDGVSTISDPNGVSVHTSDPAYFFRDAYATVDPNNHDLLIVYERTDAATQSENLVIVNRITTTGELVWNEGIRLFDNGTSSISSLKIDAFEDGSGFAVIYDKAVDNYNDVMEARGYDMNATLLWTQTVSSNAYHRISCENSTGFHGGQDIVIWTNGTDGGLYGQNIQPDGSMGPIEIPEPCDAPTNFEGSYVYNGEDQSYGVLISWNAPETQPLHYNLYVTDPSGCSTTIEIEPTETEYYDETTVIGTVMYRLIAVYEDCESDYALTPDGEDHVSLNLTGIEENLNDEIVTIMKIFNANGQSLQVKDLNELNTGLYILQGLTKDGKIVSKKVVVNK